MGSSVLDAPWTRSPEEILAHFGVDGKCGLSGEQVNKHVKLYGKNGTLVFGRVSVFSNHICLKNCRKSLLLHCGS